MAQKTEKRPPKILLILMFLFFSSVFVVSLYHVFSYFYQGAQQSNLNESMIEEGIETLEPNTTQAVLVPITLPSGKTESVLVQTTPDISVDFSKLQKKYPKMVGWLYSQDKKYNHPIMQTRDNSYYVTHLPDGRVNHAGSLFLDCRDPSDFSAWNHVIYGHNMANGSMFGDLLEYQNRDYFKQHPYLFYFTEQKTYRLEVFSAFFTTTESIVYTRPDTVEKKQEFLSHALKNSAFNAGISVSESDAVLVLSTCSTSNIRDNNRFVVIAKLVPLESGN